MSSSSLRAERMMIGVARSIRICLQTSSRRPGEHQIEHHEIDLFLTDHTQRVVAAGDRHHIEPGILEREFDDRADRLLVFDHHDAFEPCRET